MMERASREPWRIVAGVLSVLLIVFMWAKKDVAVIYATMPKEQWIPLIVTTVLVTLLKVGAIAGGVLLLRWIVRKIKERQERS